MVTAKESQTHQQFSAWNSSYLDHMALLGIEQNYSLPCFRPYTPTANVAFPGHAGLDLNMGHQDSVGRFLKLIPPNGNIADPTGNPCLKDAQCALPHRLGVADKPIDAPQKRFLIFDQSGSHTRLFVSPSFSHQNQIFASETTPNATAYAPREEVAALVDQQFLMKPIVEEKWDENHLTDEEDEMLEDTEEIDALLYSDSDDDEYDDDNDEVTSTGHSPFVIEEEGYAKDEEVASSQPKRQRLLDGKYKNPSSVTNDSPMQRAISYEDDAQSSCAGDRTSYDHINSNKREKKVKIRQAMKILETIIPGLSINNDPLSIIDKAIAHLKSMKTEVESHGFSHPGYESPSFP